MKCSFAQHLYLYFPSPGFGTPSLLPIAPYNQPHWPDPAYASLYEQAVGALDAGKREELVHEMMKTDFEDGSYIVPSYNKTVDILAGNVQGLTTARTGYSLGNFAWRTVWLS